MTYGQYITQLYSAIYLIIVTVITLLYFSKYRYMKISLANKTDSASKDWSSSFTCLLAVALSLFTGLRPLHGFGDSSNYIEYYNLLEFTKFSFNYDTENIIWDNFFAWWASSNLGIRRFFLFVATCYYTLTLVACRKIFPNNFSIAYIVFLGAFSTFSYSVNGIKAGLASTLFVLACAYRHKLLVCILLMLTSWGIHHSMQLPVIAFIITLFYKNTKTYFYIWLACIVLAFAHVDFFANLFASMTDESGSKYLMGGSEDGTKGGFRLDFILYSSIPVLIGFLAIFKKGIKVSEQYKQILNLYLCTNSVWMLCMYASFTNRMAYLSWFLYPFVLIYPLLNENWGLSRNKTLTKIILGHLGFTIILFFYT